MLLLLKAICHLYAENVMEASEKRLQCYFDSLYEEAFNEKHEQI